MTELPCSGADRDPGAKGLDGLPLVAQCRRGAGVTLPRRAGATMPDFSAQILALNDTSCGRVAAWLAAQTDSIPRLSIFLASAAPRQPTASRRCHSAACSPWQPQGLG